MLSWVASPPPQRTVTSSPVGFPGGPVQPALRFGADLPLAYSRPAQLRGEDQNWAASFVSSQSGAIPRVNMVDAPVGALPLMARRRVCAFDQLAPTPRATQPGVSKRNGSDPVSC